MSRNTRYNGSWWATAIVLAIPVIILLLVVEILWGPNIRTGLTVLWFTGSAAIIVFAAIIAGVALALRGVSSSGNSSYYDKTWNNAPMAFAGVAIAVVALLGGIVSAVSFGYNTDAKYVAEMEVIENKPVPEFADRAPFDVAVASAKKQLGDTAGTVGQMKILPAESDNGLWAAPIVRRGMFVGYESVMELNLPLFGTGNAKTQNTCDFDKDLATHRAGGALPHNSLRYLVNSNTPLNVVYDGADLYSYCDGDTPFVVAPLKQVTGFWYPEWSSAGAAVYNGSTGELQILTDTSEIPGPVYPISLAERQRSALPAIDKSFTEHFFGRSGWVSTSKATESVVAEEDTDDPNTLNATELNLRYLEESESGYVTSLTPRGESTSVTAVSVVDSGTAEAGTRNPLRIYVYKDGEHREANSTMAQSIRSDFSYMPDWASGLKVFEVAPGKDGSWVASIGQTQSVVYRAIIAEDGSITLIDGKGKAMTGTSSTGSGEEPAPAPVAGRPVDPGVDLSTLTPAELQELGNEILSELAKRGGE